MYKFEEALARFNFTSSADHDASHVMARLFQHETLHTRLYIVWPSAQADKIESRKPI